MKRKKLVGVKKGPAWKQIANDWDLIIGELIQTEDLINGI
jgi:hypothetical protein